MPFPAGRDGARPLQGTGAGRRQGALRVWLPPAKFRNGIWGVSHRHRPLRPAGDGTPGSSCPTGGCGGRRDCPGQRRTAKRLHCGREEMGGNCSRDHPQRGHQPRTIPQSRPLAVPAPFAQGSLGDVGIRPFYDGWGSGPPYLGHGLRRPNSVPEFGASVRSPCPTEAMRVLHRSIRTQFVVLTTFRRRDPYAGSCYPGAGGIRYH